MGLIVPSPLEGKNEIIEIKCIAKSVARYGWCPGRALSLPLVCPVTLEGLRQDLHWPLDPEL